MSDQRLRHSGIKATREGLIGKSTASGYVIDKVVPFIALPARGALHKRVLVVNPKNGKSSLAIVLDVGPWNGGLWESLNTDDDLYVLGGARPQAESGKDLRG